MKINLIQNSNEIVMVETTITGERMVTGSVVKFKQGVVATVKDIHIGSWANPISEEKELSTEQKTFNDMEKAIKWTNMQIIEKVLG
ncbi:MAG: hypothetical protein RR313_10940 [Anaerovoracaceae bacterium]